MGYCLSRGNSQIDIPVVEDLVDVQNPSPAPSSQGLASAPRMTHPMPRWERKRGLALIRLSKSSKRPTEVYKVI